MTPADWILSLVFEAPDGEFHLEPRPYHGGLGEALGLARRDAQACAFGRTFRGFAAIEASTESFTVDSAPRAQRSPQDPCRPLIELLTPHRVEDQGQLTAETPRHPVQLPGVEAIHWWALEGAFGMATQAGVALGRCSSTDATEAEGAARQLGSIISHQRQLFPVTAKALAWRRWPKMRWSDRASTQCGPSSENSVGGARRRPANRAFRSASPPLVLLAQVPVFEPTDALLKLGYQLRLRLDRGEQHAAVAVLIDVLAVGTNSGARERLIFDNESQRGSPTRVAESVLIGGEWNGESLCGDPLALGNIEVPNFLLETSGRDAAVVATQPIWKIIAMDATDAPHACT